MNSLTNSLSRLNLSLTDEWIDLHKNDGFIYKREGLADIFGRARLEGRHRGKAFVFVPSERSPEYVDVIDQDCKELFSLDQGAIRANKPADIIKAIEKTYGIHLEVPDSGFSFAHRKIHALNRAILEKLYESRIEVSQLQPSHAKDDFTFLQKIQLTFEKMAYNSQRDLFENILPYVHSVVSSNLNASYIELSCQRYILSQMPTASTVNKFFEYVRDTDTTTIVALTNDSCYWNAFSLVEQNKDYTVRSHTLGNKKIVHIEVLGWADKSDYPIDRFTNVLDTVDRLHQSGTIWVHCKAGVGRSGTFAISHNGRKQLRSLKQKNQPLICSIREDILVGRMQRDSLVQNPAQLKMIYETYLKG